MACAFFDIESPLERPKLLRTPQFLTLLTSKCASRHNAVHFFKHLNFQECSETLSFYTFDFQMCFAPQRRALWSTSQLPRSAPRPSVFNTFYFQMCFAPQRRALFQHLNFQECSADPQFLHFWLPNMLRAHNALFQHLNFQKCSEPLSLTHFTSKCASRHNSVHFFNISISKTAPRPSVFNTFYFQMCFALQRRALFPHLNFQECSETPQFLTLFTSKCASRHNAVHFFNISTSKSAPRPSVFNTVYFQMCFAPQRRALFQHLKLPKSAPRPSVFNTFDFQMCFAPQRRALFQHLNFQECSRDPQFLTLFTSKCASRHNAVHFFNISTSKSAPHPPL